MEVERIARALGAGPLAADQLWDPNLRCPCALGRLLMAAGVPSTKLAAFDKAWILKVAGRQAAGGRSYDELLFLSFRMIWERYGITNVSQLEAMSDANDRAAVLERRAAVLAACAA